ncbi:MAG: hypothetical protein CMJ06_04505 [Pelagibacterales bacterium]|nr:hypothetical protein [Pelagibacterales bacterium]OUU61971.1 MAG: hypothetical protein CBC22_05955 [Alphaproteobacteria bacterium TMED62]|tara:strand:- start:8092 stop:9138 length:1047 start_codon:yes stop_codon:yes gene_type:complete
MGIINLKNISLNLNDLNILKNITFSLNKKEIVSLVGPSGSGKSSILRIIAGLLKPTEGYVFYYRQLLSSNKNMIPTGQRKIALMFQEDVLFPHLSVFKNISFGIENKSSYEKDELVLHYLKEFNLLEKKNNFPNSLSGGEKQRVALARVLITEPKALLMDEPFSNLDINLRKDVCNYTIETLKKNNIPVIFVTHDIEEAMSISDKIIVIKKGKILQIDTPKKIYSNPNNKCVAEMLGSINQLEIKPDKYGILETPFGKINCNKCNIKDNNYKTMKHYCLIRPENIIIGKKGVKAKVINKYFLGASWSYQLDLGDKFPILSITNCKKELKKNQYIRVNASKKNILIFQE